MASSSLADSPGRGRGRCCSSGSAGERHHTRLTRPRTPTTTGKIERWHKTLRTEFLAACDSFASLACALAELDAWVGYYNRERPHQSLGMATPASRFTATAPPAGSSRACRCGCHPRSPPRPASGNMFAAGRQIWLGKPLAGQRVTLRLDAKLIHVITAGGVLARTLPSPLTPTARGRLHGARLAGPPPATPPALQVTRVISSQGGLMVAGVKIHLGHAHRRGLLL